MRILEFIWFNEIKYIKALFKIVLVPKKWWSWWSRSLDALENREARAVSL
jgi:hypothetical protein